MQKEEIMKLPELPEKLKLSAERMTKEAHIWRSGKNLAPAIKAKAFSWIEREYPNALDGMLMKKAFEEYTIKLGLLT